MGSSINKSVEDCRSKGKSYQLVTEEQLASHFRDFYKHVKLRSPEVSQCVIKYLEEGKPDTFLVVKIRFELLVAYGGKKNFSVFASAVFPPCFPLVPPIFAVKNPDPKHIGINKRYAGNPLPDASFEVKLFGSDDFKATKKCEPLIDEFKEAICANFPYFAVKVPTETYFPRCFDRRYNDPLCIFPFDYRLDAESFDEIGEGLKEIRVEFIHDLDILRSKVEVLHIEEEKVNDILQTLSGKVEQLGSQSENLHKAVQSLSVQTAFFNRKQMSGETVQELVAFDSPAVASLQKARSDLKAVRKTIYFLEEAFLERPQWDHKQFLDQTTRLFRKEFELKLQLTLMSEQNGFPVAFDS